MNTKDFRIYNRALTEQEVKDYHNQFVTPSLQEDFSSEGADEIAKVPTGWVKQSGSFKVGEIITPDSVLETIKKGTKYLECVTAGLIAIPSKQAYGTWEFDLFHYTGNKEIYFISDKSNILGSGYRLRFTSDNRIQFSRFTGGSYPTLWGTNSNYLMTSNW